ncbi:indole-3-glycerol phosphate synthase [Helicobacter sp. NHP22-001]|uniref:indole-3-glycerol phosphate synthase n=1 Tax=Helicobacter sp. NHP22-001 TaxID=3040202 RepID=UPI00244D8EB0|nr:indole-3-glycerol phosphate synthase [Helicobacter sp. NHP22-001]GMB96041.1 indole-3-glycerol phosphate synthase TrpC [Helicobacter sp. NHP22-001]
MPIDNLKALLKLKQEIRPFELLGRSLAYNPYLPRLSLEQLKRPKETPLAHALLALDLRQDLEQFLKNLQKAQESQALALLLDFTPLYAKEPSLEMLDLLGYVRRLCTKPLISKDLIVDRYQILEALVYGVDALVLDPSLLQKDLKDMLAYTTHLGLLGIVQVASVADLKNAILARARALYIVQDFKEILQLVPQGLVILKDLNTPPIDPTNSYGVDGLVLWG